MGGFLCILDPSIKCYYVTALNSLTSFMSEFTSSQRDQAYEFAESIGVEPEALLLHLERRSLATLVDRGKNVTALNPGLLDTADLINIDQLIFFCQLLAQDLKSKNNIFFQFVIDSSIKLGINVEQIAHAVGVSVPSVQKWQSGQAFPHPLGRPAIGNVIADLLSQIPDPGPPREATEVALVLPTSAHAS